MLYFEVRNYTIIRMKDYLVHFMMLLSLLSKAQPLIPFLQDQHYGFASIDGNLVIPAQFDEVGFFNRDGLADVRKGNQWSVINRIGKILLPFELDERVKLSYAVTNEPYIPGKYVPPDTLFQLLLQSTDLDSFRILNLETGYYTRKYCRTPMDASFEFSFRFIHHVGTARVSDTEFHTLNEAAQTIVISTQPPSIWTDSFLSYSEQGRQVLFNFISGKKIVFPFEEIEQCVLDDYFIVANQNPGPHVNYNRMFMGLVDKTGKIIIDLKYHRLSYFHGNKLAATLEDTTYLIDFSGIRIDSNTYWFINSLFDNAYLGTGKESKKMQVLDEDGRSVGLPLFHKMDQGFCPGLIKFFGDDTICIVDSMLRPVFMITNVDDVYNWGDHYQIVKDQKVGMVTRNGQMTLPVIYDGIISTGNPPLIYVTKDGKKGLMWHFLQGYWYRFLVDAKILQIEEWAKKENRSVNEIIEDKFKITFTKPD